MVTARQGTQQGDYYVSKYAPLSLAYFDCRGEGAVSGSTCAKCEQIYADAENDTKAHNIVTDADLITYVKAQNLDCVNHVEGGN